MKPTAFAAALLALSLAAPAWAVDVIERSNASALWFDGGQQMTNAQLTITGPEGFTASVDASRGLPSFRMQGAGPMKDGLYKYVLTAATNERITLENQIDNGRGDAARDFAFKPFSKYGAFRVSRGAIVIDAEGAGGSDQDE